MKDCGLIHPGLPVLEAEHVAVPEALLTAALAQLAKQTHPPAAKNDLMFCGIVASVFFACAVDPHPSPSQTLVILDIHLEDDIDYDSVLPSGSQPPQKQLTSYLSFR